MITDARVLDVETVPRRDLVEHRNDELNALASALDHLLDGERGGHAHLFGPSGSGKTVVARLILRDLERELLDVRTHYVNCWEHHSRFDALYQLLDGVGRTYDVQQGRTPHDELLRRIDAADEQPYVVVLDEVDQLDDPRILYRLYRMQQVTLVLIANREADLFEALEERLVSRLRGGPRVVCDAYGVPALSDILEKRAEAALEAGVWSRSVLEAIADRAAGDARVAIQLLRETVRIARSEEADAIGVDHVGEAEPEAREQLQQKTISKLNRHQRILYECLDEDEWLGMADLEERYRDAIGAGEARSRPTLRRYLGKMQHYNLVEKTGEKRWTRYRRL